MPKVSIIVPIYNTSKYLNKCIDSLINQTEKNIEIVLVNDGSTDESENIIKEYKDKRIKYIKKKNTGIGSTRNRGIKKSTGDFIIFIDSDDYIAYDCVEKLYNYAIKTKSDVVVSDFYKDIDGKFEEFKIQNFAPTTLKKNPNLITFINLGPCNKIYKRELVKDIKFDEKLKYEDVPFVVNALKNADKISKINECLSYYVIHNNSQTTTRDQKIFDIFKIIDIIKNILKEDEYRDSLVNLITMLLADYTIQQRYIRDGKQRSLFIDKAFKILDEIDKNWRHSSYMKNLPKSKRFIKSHKFLIKFYCFIYPIMKK